MTIAGKVLIFYLLAGYFSYSLHVSWLSKNYNRRNTYFVSHSSFLNTMDIDTSLSLPQWYDSLLSIENRVDVREWYDEEWRNTEGGFSGVDFCHSPSASVRILDYFILSNKNNDVEDNDNNNNFKLVGAVHFSNKCESHRGLCHGGTFCAVMDDAIGWMGFCVTGTARPWLVIIIIIIIAIIIILLSIGLVLLSKSTPH